MSTSTPLYHQLLGLLSQHSKYRDFRHLKALAWMINALICSSKINLSEWESYVISRATQAQSIERRWQRFVHNRRIKVKSLYVTIHGARRHPIELKYLYPPKSEATLYHNVGLWLDGECRSNFVLANVKGAKDPWAVITDEEPTLKTLWQYALRFRIEELFLDSKSGVFQLEESKIRACNALERLYLVVALAILFTTAHGMTVQLKGLRTQVDPHWERGLSYLKIGIRWLKGVLHKSRDLFDPVPLFSQNTLPCFASKKAKQKYYDAISFTRISELRCLKV